MKRLITLYSILLTLALSSFMPSPAAHAQFQNESIVAKQLIDEPLLAIPWQIDGDDLMDLVYLTRTKVQWIQNQDNGNFKFNDILSLSEGQQSFEFMLLDNLIGDEGEDILAVIQLDDLSGSLRLIQNINGEYSPGPLTGSFSLDDATFALLDMDDDGDKDLIIAQRASGELQWLNYLGDGIFSEEPTPITTAENLLDVGIGDINTDGLDDLVVLAGEIDGIANEGSNVVVWYENIGESLAEASAIVTDGGLFTSMYCGLVDDDNQPDVILGSADLESSLLLVWNDGGGTFSTTVKQLLPNGPGTGAKFISLCQVDGILSPDILITSNEGSRTAWIRNYGDRTFAAEVQVQQPNELGDFLSCTDLDNNGHGDLIRIHTATDAFNVYYSDAIGDFDNNLPIVSESDGPVTVLKTQANGDESMDLLVISTNDWKVQTYLQIAPFVFGSATVHDATLPYPEGGALVDMNTDGFKDILLWSPTTDMMGWMINLGDNQYLNVQTSNFVPGSFKDICTGYFNGDGLSDLAFVTNDGDVKAYAFFGSDFFLTVIDHDMELPAAVATGYFGGDDQADLVCYDQELQEMTFLVGDGEGDFAEDFSVSVPLSIANPHIITGQFDLDGIDDIVLYGEDGAFLSFLSQNSWQAPEVQSLPCTFLKSLTASDYNLDGDDDLCFSCIDPEQGIGIGYNDGAGSFSYSTLFNTWSADYAELSDLDNDADPDLLWLNTGTDQVSASMNFTLVYTSLIDLNQDGVEDIADLLVLLADMGCQGDCVGDLNGDTLVNIMDLILFLSLFQTSP